MPFDPVGVRVIEALARRAAGQQGEARALLMQRVQALQAAHEVARIAAAQSDGAETLPSDRCSALAGLSALVDRLGRSAAVTEVAPAPRAGAAMRPSRAPGSAPPLASASPVPLKAVAAFKGTWSRLRADQRLRQAMAQVPAMAGPLNSSHVMNRTLQTLRELSPEYLDAFMLHVDTLMWLEQASGGGLPKAHSGASPEGRRRPAARSARKG